MTFSTFLQTLCCLAVVALALRGVSGSCGLRDGAFKPSAFSYYTTQSNLLMALYHLLTAAALVFRLDGLLAFLRLPGLHVAMALCITVTFLVFHFLLWPSFKKVMGSSRAVRFDNFCVHYLVPWLTVLYWLLWGDKAGLVFADALRWLALPLCYVAFAILRAHIGPPIGQDGERYPYLFMDFDRLGTKKVLCNFVLMITAYFVLGCLFVFGGRLIG